MIVDCHVHLNDYSRTKVPGPDTIRELLDAMGRNGVDQAFILSSYMTNESRPSIERVIELTKGHPELFVVEGIPFREDGSFDLSGTEKRLASGDVIGLKMYPGYQHYYPTDKVCEPVYELATRYRAPVMFHAGDTYAKRAKLKYSHPLLLDEVAVDHPDLRMVICHLGNPWFRDTAEVLYKNDNVRADISGLVLGELSEKFESWLAPQVREVIAYAGAPEDLLFGTDWPLVAMSPYLRFVRSLDLEPGHLDMLLGGNAREWFRIDAFEKRRAGV